MERLFQAYYKPLVVWADTFLNDMGRAEDLVQDFFVKLWEKGLTTGLQPETLKSYLFTAVRNQSINRLDKKDPLKRVYDVALFEKPWEEYSDFDEDVMRKVEQAVEQLPPRGREVVQAVYLKGMRYKEAADALGISVATVKTLLVHSLKTLRKNSCLLSEVLVFFYLRK